MKMNSISKMVLLTMMAVVLFSGCSRKKIELVSTHEYETVYVSVPSERVVNKKFVLLMQQDLTFHLDRYHINYILVDSEDVKYAKNSLLLTSDIYRMTSGKQVNVRFSVVDNDTGMTLETGEYETDAWKYATVSNNISAAIVRHIVRRFKFIKNK